MKKKKLRWYMLYGVTGIVDAIQIVIDFTGVGIAVSEAMEVAMPFVLLGLFALFKISIIKHPKRIVSILGVAIGDAITGGIAPFWILDVYYIHGDVKKEEAAQAEQENQEMLLQNNIRQPLNEDGVRAPRQNEIRESASPANISGIRVPRGGLVSSYKQ